MRAFLAGTLLLVALAAAGCRGSSSRSNGEASKPAQQVLADAVHAAKGATSFHVSAHVHFQDTGAPFSFDMTLVKGKGGTASFGSGPQKVDSLVIGTDAYLKADADFWKNGVVLGAAIAQKYAGRWVKVPPTDSRFIDYVNFADSGQSFASLTSSQGAITNNNGTTTYKGQRVVEIDGPKLGTVYVAATGTAYPVAIVHAGARGGTITFDRWNRSVTLAAPADAIDFGRCVVRALAQARALSPRDRLRSLAPWVDSGDA